MSTSRPQVGCHSRITLAPIQLANASLSQMSFHQSVVT